MKLLLACNRCGGTEFIEDKENTFYCQGYYQHMLVLDEENKKVVCCHCQLEDFIINLMVKFT